MSAERDRNTSVMHGRIYPVREMVYLCEVEMARYSNDARSRKELQLMMESLETLPDYVSVSFVMNPNTQTFHFLAFNVGGAREYEVW